MIGPQDPRQAPRVKQPKADRLGHAFPGGHPIPQLCNGPGRLLRCPRFQVFSEAMQAQLRVSDSTLEHQQPICYVPCPATPDRLKESLQELQEAEPGGTVHRVIK